MAAGLPCKEDSAYRCGECPYVLHVSCARLPKTLRHASHPSHALTLQLLPPYPNGHFRCDACGEESVAFCFHCPRCRFDLHLPCAALPQQLNHPLHPQHHLTLVYGRPSDREAANTAFCDMCGGMVFPSRQWFYVCEACDVGGHVGCFTTTQNKEQTSRSSAVDDATGQRPLSDTIESLLSAQRQMQRVALQSQMMEMGHRTRMAIIDNLNTNRITRTYYPSYSYSTGFSGALANTMMLESLAKALNDSATARAGSSQQQQQPEENAACDDRDSLNFQFRGA